MDMRNNRNTMILVFILLMLGAIALAQANFLIIMFLLGMLFLVRQFDNNQMGSQEETTYDYDENYSYGDDHDYYDTFETTRQAQSDPVYRHALDAVQRAGQNPDEVPVLVVDLGIMSFKGQDEPTVFRTWNVPDDVDYIQPFVQLRLPSKATGRVKFELVDSDGKAVFIHEDHHNLQRGRNFITPSARLPIHDALHMDGRWGLRVSADGVLLADHRFEFAESNNPSIRQHIGEDGEINTELRAIMQENRLPKMSLDDLLAYQDDEESQKRSGSK